MFGGYIRRHRNIDQQNLAGAVVAGAKGYIIRSFDGADKRKMMFELTSEGVKKKLEISEIDFNLDFNVQ